MNPQLPDWFLDWSNDACIIIASGPSAKDVDVASFKGLAKFIAVNESWKLAPWADVLLCADGNWWHRHKGLPKFAGLKVTCDFTAARTFQAQLLRFVKNQQRLTTDKPGTVGMGGNSGFYALNLAVQFGCKRIALVGFDMTLKHGVHWHGEHERGFSNPSKMRVDRWRDALDGEANQLKQWGVKVINVSPISELKAFPKMSLSEAMESLKCL